MIDDTRRGTDRTGLETLVEALERRFVLDAEGRLSADAAAGAPVPRFVLGRAAEGCVWRFAADLSPRQIQSVAKLAGREKGCEMIGESTLPPERLVMIARLLGEGTQSVGVGVGEDVGVGENGVVPTPRREFIREGGSIVGELWSFD
ncbi:MAG: hypothetical protein AB8G23_04290 [Myxococcota bacterium]